VRLAATDSRGQTTEGPWAAVDVYRAIEMERSLVGRRSTVRAELTAVLAEQRTRREQLAALDPSLADDAERDVARSIQFAQAKIAQDADQAVRSLLGVFNTFVYDRLGAENPNAKILAFLDRHHRRTYGEPVDEPPSEAVRVGDPVFPYALYDDVVAAWRDRQIFDTGLLDRMLAVVEPAVAAAARRAPRAHVLTSDLLEGTATLEEALAGQDAVIASLEATLEAMRGWQSLNDMILLLRRIIEEQEVLDRDLGGSTGN
jgi:hypothetical protein